MPAGTTIKPALNNKVTIQGAKNVATVLAALQAIETAVKTALDGTVGTHPTFIVTVHVKQRDK